MQTECTCLWRPPKSCILMDYLHVPMRVLERQSHQIYHVSPKIKQGLILIFAPRKPLGLIFRGCFVLFFHVQQSTFIQILLCHLLAAAQRWRAGFHLTGVYFWSRAYIMCILKNHTRAYFQVRSYFQGNTVRVSAGGGEGICEFWSLERRERGLAIEGG